MSKFRLKPIIIIAVAVLLCAVIIICFAQRSSLELDDPAEIEIWYAGNTSFTDFEGAVNSFNKGEGTERLVSVSTRNFDSEAKLIEALENAASEGDELPDAVLCNCNTAAYLQDKAVLADAETYIRNWKSEVADRGIITDCTYGELTVCIPAFYETDVLIVNTGLYEDADGIADFEELCSVANTYYSENKASFFTITDYSAFFNSAMAQLGERFMAENPFDYENENVRYIYDQLATAAFKRGYAASAENPAVLVAEGKLACAVVSTPQLMAAEKKLNLDEIEIIPIPVMKEGTAVYTREVYGISILKGDENSETAAAIFIEWFTDSENLREFLDYSGYIPALDVSADASDAAVPEHYAELMQVIDELSFVDYNADPDYAVNCYEFNDIMDNIMKKSLS